MSQIDNLVEQLGKLTVIEAGELAKKLEKEWNLNYEEILQNAKPQSVETEAEEKLFKVILTGFGERKISVIKEVRQIREMGLIEAKNFVEGVPQELKGDTTTTGHVCVSTTTLDTPGQGDVRANSILIARKTDPTVPHPAPPSPPCPNHVANVNAGSGTVRVSGAFVARIGDSADAGAMTSGSSNVFSG